MWPPKVDRNLTPVIVLGALGVCAIAALVTLAFTAGDTESIRTTLAGVALTSVAAIAGLVRGTPPE